MGLSAFYSLVMDASELFDDGRRYDFRVIEPLFAIFLDLVIRIHEKICSRESLYLS